MNITRAANNPLIACQDVTPTTPDMKVVCAFNPAAARYGEETVLLLRVAETVRDVAPDEVAVPVYDCDGPEPCVRVERISRNTPGLDLSDSRAVITHDRYLLTSLSHLRLARSRDGVHFTVEKQPALFPSEPYEEYGIEDPRMTEIDGTYYITYSAVSRLGITVGLATTTDFVTYTKRGIIFGPDNKNVAIFPEKINGNFYIMHRPSTGPIGHLGIWVASSPDLLHWGNHRQLLAKRSGMWDSVRVGAGSVPIKTDKGWLAIYHGVNEEQGYCLGAVLMDKDEPHRIIARSDEPVLYPKEPYECVGFYGNVVFTCGSVVDDNDVVHIYYGAADEYTCHASVKLEEVLDHLLRQPKIMPAASIGVPLSSILD